MELRAPWENTVFGTTFKSPFRWVTQGLAVVLVSLLFAGCAEDVDEEAGERQFLAVRAQEPTYLFVHFGPFEGQSWMQEASIVVTPDDRVRCVFLQDGFIAMPGGNVIKLSSRLLKGHDSILPGVFDTLRGAIAPPLRSGSAVDKTHRENYLVEVSQNGVRGWTIIDIDKDRVAFDTFVQALKGKPHECWKFD